MSSSAPTPLAERASDSNNTTAALSQEERLAAWLRTRGKAAKAARIEKRLSIGAKRKPAGAQAVPGPSSTPLPAVAEAAEASAASSSAESAAAAPVAAPVAAPAPAEPAAAPAAEPAAEPAAPPAAPMAVEAPVPAEPTAAPAAEPMAVEAPAAAADDDEPPAPVRSAGSRRRRRESVVFCRPPIEECAAVDPAAAFHAAPAAGAAFAFAPASFAVAEAEVGSGSDDSDSDDQEDVGAGLPMAPTPAKGAFGTKRCRAAETAAPSPPPAAAAASPKRPRTEYSDEGTQTALLDADDCVDGHLARERLRMAREEHAAVAVYAETLQRELALASSLLARATGRHALEMRRVEAEAEATAAETQVLVGQLTGSLKNGLATAIGRNKKLEAALEAANAEIARLKAAAAGAEEE